MALTLFQAVGCQYYKVENASKDDYVNILSMGEIHEYFIVHAGNDIDALNNVEAKETAVSE